MSTFICILNNKNLYDENNFKLLKDTNNVECVCLSGIKISNYFHCYRNESMSAKNIALEKVDFIYTVPYENTSLSHKIYCVSLFQCLLV